MAELISPRLLNIGQHLYIRHGRRFFWLVLVLFLLFLFHQYFEQLGRGIVPLHNIVVRGGDSQNRALAERVLDEVRGDNLLNLDVTSWQEKLKALPGVRHAHVRRRLPNTLLVQLVASEPLARWHDGSLIDEGGRRYAGNVDETLPMFRGDERRIEDMVAFYHQAALLLPDNIAQVELNARGSWQLFLTNGMIVYLGQQPLPRLRRYARHAALLHETLPPLRVVDMRYPHGFAVQLHREGEQQ